MYVVLYDVCEIGIVMCEIGIHLMCKIVIPHFSAQFIILHQVF